MVHRYSNSWVLTLDYYLVEFNYKVTDEVSVTLMMVGVTLVYFRFIFNAWSTN